MAVTYVSQGAVGSTFIGNTITLDVPAGLQNGDKLLAFIHTTNAVATFSNAPYETWAGAGPIYHYPWIEANNDWPIIEPTGWYIVKVFLSYDNCYALYYHDVTDAVSEPATYEFEAGVYTLDGGHAYDGNPVDETMAGFIIAYRGAAEGYAFRDDDVDDAYPAIYTNYPPDDLVLMDHDTYYLIFPDRNWTSEVLTTVYDGEMLLHFGGGYVGDSCGGANISVAHSVAGPMTLRYENDQALTNCGLYMGIPLCGFGMGWFADLPAPGIGQHQVLWGQDCGYDELVLMDYIAIIPEEAGTFPHRPGEPVSKGRGTGDTWDDDWSNLPLVDPPEYDVPLYDTLVLDAHTEIDENVVEINGLDGIYAKDLINGTISDNNVYDNGQFVHATYYGIVIDGCNRTFAADNRVSRKDTASGNEQRYGMHVTNTSNYVRLAINDLAESGELGELLDEGNATEIINGVSGSTTVITLATDIQKTLAANNAYETFLTLSAYYSGAVVEEFGAGILWRGVNTAGTYPVNYAQIVGMVSDAGSNRGELVFYTNNVSNNLTERIRIDGNGKVGIAQSSPDNSLTIGDLLGGFTGHRITVGGSTGYPGITMGEDADNRGWVLWDPTNDQLRLAVRVTGTSITGITVAASGHIGINTTDPQYGMLQVYPTAGNADTGITLYDGAITTARLWIGTNNDLHITRSASATTGITILSTGEVGIGIILPTTALHVIGAATVEGNAYVGTTAATNTIIRWSISGQLFEWYLSTAYGFGVYDRTNTTYRLMIDTSGRVGINDVTPEAMLDVKAYTAQTNLYWGGRASQLPAYKVLVSSTWGTAAEGGIIQLYNGADAQMVNIDARSGYYTYFLANNVGIGTSTPGTALQFGGTDPVISVNTSDANDNKRIILTGGGAFGSGRGAYLQLKGNEYATDGGDAILTAGNTADAMIWFYTQATARMVIDYDGNVGIGITNPSYEFELYKSQSGFTDLTVYNDNAGTAAVARFIAHNGGSALTIEKIGGSYTTSGARIAGAGVVFESGSAGLNLVAGNASGLMRFYTGGSADANERMRITSGGLVGINVNPSYIFEIKDNNSNLYHYMVNPTSQFTGTGFTATSAIFRILSVTAGDSQGVWFRDNNTGIDWLLGADTGLNTFILAREGSAPFIQWDTSANTILGGNLFRRIDNNVLVLSGGSSVSSGANIELYGGTHASYANDAYFDADDINFRIQAATFSGVIFSHGNYPNVRIRDTAAGYGSVLRLECTDTAVVAGEYAGSIEFYKNDPSTGGAGIVGRIDSIAHDAGGSYNMLIYTGSVSTPVNTLFLTYAGKVGVAVGAPDTAYLDVYGTAGAGIAALRLRAGDTGTADSYQILFSYNASTSYTHNIRTRANGGNTSGNTIDYYVWHYGVDSSATPGTWHVATMAYNGVGIFELAPDTALHITDLTGGPEIKLETSSVYGGIWGLGTWSSAPAGATAGYFYIHNIRSGTFPLSVSGSPTGTGGTVGIQSPTPTGVLDVIQDISVGYARPVLRLEQQDDSEEFIYFAANSIGAGYPLQTSAVGTYYGKFRVYVGGVGYKYVPMYNT